MVTIEVDNPLTRELVLAAIPEAGTGRSLLSGTKPDLATRTSAAGSTPAAGHKNFSEPP